METFCRGCLSQYNEPTDFLQYNEKNRRLFVYSTGLQIKRNDTITFQLCKECYFNMKLSCKFKKQCRASDKKLKSYLMMKGEGDMMDFGSFIKIMDDNSTLRLPEAGHSTPAYQKTKDDDNDSTCTSIRNFMSDMLGEEMPSADLPLPRIIREVIEEEADICDDSLDSHWLQDDLSVHSDFNMDYSSFSPFATPRSLRNDNYTPRKLDEAKVREINYLTSKEIIEKIDRPNRTQDFDMPSLEDGKLDNDAKMNVNIKIERLDMNGDGNELESALDSSIPSVVEDLVTENSISSNLRCFQTDLLSKQIDSQSSDNANFETFDEKSDVLSDKDICIVLNQGTAEKKRDEVPLSNELEYYVNKAVIKKHITKGNKSMKGNSKDTIDRNLEIALKTEGSKEIALDQLLASPQVSIQSGASTPTIKNILFGESAEKVKLTQSSKSTPITNIIFGENLDIGVAPKYFPQVGQNIDDTDGKSDTDFMEEFLKDGIPKCNDIKVENAINDESKYTDCQEAFTKDFDNVSIKSEERNEVLDRFLKDCDGPMETDLVLDLLDQSLDHLQKNGQDKEQDVFKRPFSPLYDKYDLKKCLCKICDKILGSEKSLKIHFVKAHKCKIPSSDPHRNKAQNNKVIVCDICGKNVKGAANYVRHKKGHNKPDQIFQCDICQIIFCNRNGIQCHIMNAHPGILKKKRSKKYVCAICGKASTTETHLKLHLKRHSKKYTVTCPTCQKGFYRDYDLKLHMRSHSGERPFTCPDCPNAYKRRDTLFKHMMRHNGNDKFKCDICEVGFVTNVFLKQHLKSNKCIKSTKAYLLNPSQDLPSVMYDVGPNEIIRDKMETTASGIEVENNEKMAQSKNDEHNRKSENNEETTSSDNGKKNEASENNAQQS